MKAPKARRGRQLLGLGLGLLALVLMLRWFEHRNVFQPSRTLRVPATVLGRPYEEVTLVARDGVRLHGWFFPAPADAPRRHRVVLHCHGNGGNISHRLDVADTLLETGVNVFLFDYRGYGQSDGRPSEEGTYLDAQAAHAWLVQRGFAGDQVVAFGESLGGGVAAGLAIREPLAGLVLQSTFTSIPDLGAELFPFLPVRWLARIRYDTRARLPHLRIPVLLLHSREDTLIAFAHAERNFAVAREPRRLVEIAGDHNDFLLADRGRFRDGFARWVDELPRRLPGPPGIGGGDLPPGSGLSSRPGTAESDTP